MLGSTLASRTEVLHDVVFDQGVPLQALYQCHFLARIRVSDLRSVDGEVAVAIGLVGSRVGDSSWPSS
jgi:hypothetical protein